MNATAFSKWVRAIETYLLENGWEKVDSRWRVPKQFGIHAGDIYMMADAMNMQYEADSENLR